MITTSGYLVPIVFGEGASQELGAKAKGLGMTKALVVCDKGVKNSGIVDPLLENLKAAGVNVALFDDVLPDPPDTVIDAVVALAKKENVDGFVAIGGGSSIDTAKAANVCYKFGGAAREWATKYAMEKAWPLIAVPTTAGTGSEMTYAAVITNSDTHQKFGIAGTGCFASTAIVDPVLYVGLPLFPTVASAFDVYTHGVDAIVHDKEEPVAAAFAEKALRLTHKYLPVLVKDLKNMEARAGMAIAASFGGAAINTNMCHLSHAIGHSLGSVFHLPHGACCAVGFKDLLKRYAEWKPQRLLIAAEAMGLSLPANISPKELGEKVSAHFHAFAKSVGLPNLKAMNVPKERLEEAIKMMPLDVTNRVASLKLTEDDYRTIVMNAYDE